ncbi:MAG: hypothetical protein ACK559_15020, partial [bacterium]
MGLGPAPPGRGRRGGGRLALAAQRHGPRAPRGVPLPAGGPMSALRGAWDRFWFTPASTETLGVVRAAIGFTFVLKMIGTWGLYRGW